MRALLFLTALVAAPALAQHAHHGPANPDAALEARPVKALSDQQIADLKAGRGMGLALTAELNGYPGPAHVLELADELNLSATQRARTVELFAAMRTEAVGVGEQVMRREVELNRMFAERTADLTGLHVVLDEIGLTQATLRLVHLKYHLAMRELLTPEQTARYQTLRGTAR